MKKKLLLLTLLTTCAFFAQKQPTVQNATFDNIAKLSGTCSCSGWINRDISDQGETSTASSSSVVKLDDLESDGIYQEIAVEANSNYTLTFSHIFAVFSPTTTNNLEVFILKGSNYESGYTPAYATPDSAIETDLGYRTVAAVETVGNQIVKKTLSPPNHGSANVATISFDTGTETSIAIFVRAVGPYNAALHGQPTKDKGWMNGDSEVRIDNVSLVNNGLTISYVPTQPTVQNATFDNIAKLSGTCSCSGWINRDISDQGETSTASSSSVVKLDDLESDGIYQEIAVEANSNYTLTFSHIFAVFSPTTTNNLEVFILKGSNYESGYTPAYATPDSAIETDLGYRTVASVETVGNQIVKKTLSPPNHGSANVASISFDTGTETSIAIFVRAVGPYNAALHGQPTKDKGWMNGDSEVRIDNVSLINNGYSNNNWLGTSTLWEATGNWSLTSLPTEFNRVVISNTGTNPTIGNSTGVKAYSLNIDSNDGASLSIDSGGSIIVSDLSSGNLTYNLAIVDDNWHLVSSPVSGETYGGSTTWIGDNNIDSGVTDSNNRGISTYSNGTPNATTGPWTYYNTVGGTETTFASGTGYSMKSTGLTTYGFTGTYPTLAPINITQGAASNNWNLIGNPSPSYIDVAAFITANTSNLSGAYQSLHVYNGTTYTGLTSGYIHPGQAFFVNSNVASGSVSITSAMQSHRTGITFYKTNKTSIDLTISEGSNSRKTFIEYVNNSTLGLDPGKDIGRFNGVKSSLSLYTQLLEDNENIGFERQALPNSDFESMVIPVGIKVEANKEITFSATALNFPKGINVFLEDREKKVFTNLNNEDYTFTSVSNINGVGRFFIHTTSGNALSTESLEFAGVSIYKKNSETLTITGLQEEEASISMYNVLGKQVMSSSFKSKSNMDINLPKLAKGVYIVQLKTEKGSLNKKIILE